MAFEQYGGDIFESSLAGGVIGSLLALGALVGLLIGVALYVYFALSWRQIARKLKYKNDWLAWIPIASWAMQLQLGGFHWAWIFLILAPIVGWIPLFVLLIIATWRIFSKLNYPGWFSLSIVIPKVGGVLYLVAIGFVAWSKKASGKTDKVVSKKKAPKKKARKKR